MNEFTYESHLCALIADLAHDLTFTFETMNALPMNCFLSFYENPDDELRFQTFDNIIIHIFVPAFLWQDFKQNNWEEFPQAIWINLDK